MNQLKKIAKTTLPHNLIGFFTSFFYGWKGNYSNWQEAKIKSTGYDAENILEKVKNATLKVKNGKAAFERDSVLFYQEDYNFQLLSSIFWVAAQNKGKLNVLDFGGALGSVYFQNKSLFEKLDNVTWNIVEQTNFVNAGKAHFQNKHLRYYETIDECLSENQVNIILLSSVLQYLEKPFELLEEIKNAEIKYLLIDRTPLVKTKDRITVQKVHPKIYKAKYPCWFFNETKFKDELQSDYEQVFEFNSLDNANIKSQFKGFLFKLKN